MARWSEQPAISARSVLVTILGDSLAALGGTVWLADLFELTAPFGYSQRLVRTSMYRLAAEGWVANERIGRRSQYTLTDFARAEFLAADRRIYQPPAEADEPWSGRWTTVLTHTELLTTEERDRVTSHLRWRGFVELSRGLWALPITDSVSDAETPSDTEIDELFERLDLGVKPPVAISRFTNTEQLTADNFFASSFHLAATEAHYQDLIDNHAWIADDTQDGLDRASGELWTPVEAFIARTMLIHDLRRARLNDPDLPRALLPDPWVGDAAMAMASRLYDRLSPLAWGEVERVTGLDLAHADQRLQARWQPGRG